MLVQADLLLKGLEQCDQNKSKYPVNDPELHAVHNLIWQMQKNYVFPV